MKRQSSVPRRVQGFSYRGLAVAVLLIFAIFHFRDEHKWSSAVYWQTGQLKGLRNWDRLPIEPGWTYNYTTDASNLLLTQSHCQQSFPLLLRNLDTQVRTHRVGRNKIQEDAFQRLFQSPSIVRAMIFDEQLYVISTGRAATSDRSLAVLSQIYRALVTAPETVPNIEFAFSVDDRLPPSLPVWTPTRALHDSGPWLIPDVEYFSWPEIGSGNFPDVRRKAEDVDRAVRWQEKSNKLHWRGATMGNVLQEDLINVTSGRYWADVKEIDWYPRDGSLVHGTLNVGEHCKAKYLAHAETKPYGTRLKYLQLCKSVVISHRLTWETHFSHLMQRDGHEQNYLEVADDWSDLEAKVRHLREWDALGERIAKNSVETFRERYLTPAAEVCYWRRLFRGWAQSTTFEPQLYIIGDDGTRQDRGVPFESFILERRLDRHIL